MISIFNMYKTYKINQIEIHALKNINLHIQKGEFAAIVGPSGSGKTTLMNMMGCLDVPTSGSYVLDNVETSEMRDDELAEIRNNHIGFIFQSFNLIQKLTALENVELPLIYSGVRSKDRLNKAMASLETVGLEDRFHHKPNELSGGQQQRVAIARALVNNPPIILADEPTGNLDTASGKEIMDILKKLNDNGSTIILITHDNTIAAQTHRVIRINDGEIAVRKEEAV